MNRLMGRKQYSVVQGRVLLQAVAPFTSEKVPAGQTANHTVNMVIKTCNAKVHQILISLKIILATSRSGLMRRSEVLRRALNAFRF